MHVYLNLIIIINTFLFFISNVLKYKNAFHRLLLYKGHLKSSGNNGQLH